MRKIVIGLFAWVLISASLIFTGVRQSDRTPAALNSEILPIDISKISLESNEDKLRFLLYLNKYIPNIFTDSMNYKIDLYEVLNDQNKLQEMLNASEEYLKVTENRKPFLAMDVSLNKEMEVTHSVVDERLIESWKKVIIRVISSFKKETSLIDLEQKIVDLYLKTEKHSLEGIITGLIQTLDSPYKEEAFRISDIEMKVRYIFSHVKSENLIHFNFDVHGLPSNTSIAKLKSLLQKQVGYSKKLDQYLNIFVGLRYSGAGIENTDDMREYFSVLNSDKVSALKDKDVYQEHLEYIIEKIKSRANKKVQAKSIFKNYEKSLSRYLKTFKKTEKIGFKKLRLVEVGPRIGIFRGCLGGDCSSSASFPYPNDPNERVFYIFDETGNAKGYIQGTIVNSDGVKSFYAITVAGPRLSGSDTKIALHALAENLESIGVEKMVLPHKSKLGNLINYKPIREAMISMSNHAKSEEIEYLNGEVREIIENYSQYNTGGLDKRENNQLAHDLVTKKGYIDNIETQVSERVLLNEDLPKISVGRAKQLAFLLKVNDLEKSSKGILSSIGLAEDEFEQDFRLFNNKDHIPQKEFLEKFDDLVKKYHLDEPSMKSLSRHRWSGIFESSDTLSFNNMDRTSELFVNAMKGDIGDLKFFLVTFIQNHEKEFFENQVFQNFLWDVLKDPKLLEHYGKALFVDNTDHSKILLRMISEIYQTEEALQSFFKLASDLNIPDLMRPVLEKRIQDGTLSYREVSVFSDSVLSLQPDFFEVEEIEVADGSDYSFQFEPGESKSFIENSQERQLSQLQKFAASEIYPKLSDDELVGLIDKDENFAFDNDLRVQIIDLIKDKKLKEKYIKIILDENIPQGSIAFYLLEKFEKYNEGQYLESLLKEYFVKSSDNITDPLAEMNGVFKLFYEQLNRKKKSATLAILLEGISEVALIPASSRVRGMTIPTRGGAAPSLNQGIDISPQIVRILDKVNELELTDDEIRQSFSYMAKDSPIFEQSSPAVASRLSKLMARLASCKDIKGELVRAGSY